jgi:hypothetical protein
LNIAQDKAKALCPDIFTRKWMIGLPFSEENWLAGNRWGSSIAR